jgi:putative endonuclease
MYYLYILYSQKIDRYYIGFTADIKNRLTKHNNNSSGFTNKGKPWVLVYYETYETKQQAMAREKQLKSWKNRERIEALVKAGSEHPD